MTTELFLLFRHHRLVEVDGIAMFVQRQLDRWLFKQLQQVDSAYLGTVLWGYFNDFNVWW